MRVLKIKKLSPDSILPLRATNKSAGLDLFAISDDIIKPNQTKSISTGLSLCIPDGCYGRIASRSGLALKYGITVIGGVIDQDYTGEIIVILHNLGDKDFKIEKYSRIAQLIIEKICLPKIKICENLDETDRANGGFGSTGMFKYT